MIARACWYCLLILVFVPLSVAGAEPEARRFWERGQAAMLKGQLDLAVAFYEQSLAEDPRFFRSNLSLAAAYLEKGEHAAACRHLGTYLDTCPEQFIVRAHYAELLLRVGRIAEARKQFERSIADGQEQPRTGSDVVIRCHCKLVSIAEVVEDEYAERLHRGIGLYLLADKRATLEHPEGELPVEGLLCRAAEELSEARSLRCEEAQPCWYLHQVWLRLAQRQPAQCALRRAEAAAAFSYLTPAEGRELRWAARTAEAPALRQ